MGGREAVWLAPTRQGRLSPKYNPFHVLHCLSTHLLISEPSSACVGDYTPPLTSVEKGFTTCREVRVYAQPSASAPLYFRKHNQRKDSQVQRIAASQVRCLTPIRLANDRPINDLSDGLHSTGCEFTFLLSYSIYILVSHV